MRGEDIDRLEPMGSEGEIKPTKLRDTEYKERLTDG